jgi:hypothetical protein
MRWRWPKNETATGTTTFAWHIAAFMRIAARIENSD